MVFYDMNRDGKKDIRDNYIQYQAYNEAVQNRANQSAVRTKKDNRDTLANAVLGAGIGLICFPGSLLNFHNQTNHRRRRRR